MIVDPNNTMPPEFDLPNGLCSAIVEHMKVILVDGEHANVFEGKLETELPAEIYNAIEDGSGPEQLFLFLQESEQYQKIADLLLPLILPSVLSDMVVCFEEALRCSSQGRLSITYMLVRKPLQESLYFAESMLLGDKEFAENFSRNPLKLRPKNAGGLDGHVNRITKVLNTIDRSDWFDATYLAQLRYDKTNDDNFVKPCNHAIHLFTEHPAIRTEPFNANFIFSNELDRDLQWHYLYTRLPYLLFYISQVVEAVLAKFSRSPQRYLDDLNSQISALMLVWSDVFEDLPEPINRLILNAKLWLDDYCIARGGETPGSEEQLLQLAKNGKLPGETDASHERRRAVADAAKTLLDLMALSDDSEEGRLEAVKNMFDYIGSDSDRN